MKTSKIFYWFVLLGIFIVPFVPFLVSKTMLFPFITGKGFFFRILTEITFGFWVILALKDSQYRPKMTKISWSIILFGIIIFIADIFGENSYKSIWSNYERMEGYVAIIHMIMYYFVLTSTLKNKIWDYFLNTNLFASFIMSSYGALQVLGKIEINQGGVRVDGRLGNATYLAIYLVFNIFIALWMFYKNNNSKIKYIYLVSILFNSVILYFTATRGAILGLVFGLIASSIYLIFKERESNIKKISIYFISVIIVLGISFFLMKDASFIKTSPVLSRFSTLSVNEIKSQGRWFVWPMAIEGFKERPILGWGQENFNYVFNKNYNPQMYNQEQWFDRTHNVILDWLIAGGILGLLSYLSIFFFALVYLLKKTNLSNVEKSILLGLIVAYFFHNLFVFDNLISYIMFFSIVALINSNSTKEVSSKIYNDEIVNYGIAPAVLILTILSIYFVNIPAMMQSKYIIKGIQSYEDGVTKNIEYMTKAFEYNSFGNSEAVEQIVPLSSQIYQLNYPSDIKQKVFDLAYKEIKLQVEKTPNDTRYLVLYGSFLNRFGKYDEALTVLNKAIETSPKKPAVYLELGSVYLGKGDTNKALEIFEKAYNIEPRFKDSIIVYSVGSIYAGRQDVFAKLSQNITEQDFVTDNRFLKAFVDVKNYNVAITILNKRLELIPDDPNTMLSLAAIYSEIGNKNKSIEIIKTIIEKNPSFKEQGDFYIKELSK